MLQPFAYHCPGLIGPHSRQNISRQTFGDVLKGPDRIVIPIFQRRYCWDEVRVLGWWNDVLRGKRDHLGLHNSGNIVVKKFPDKVSMKNADKQTSDLQSFNDQSVDKQNENRQSTDNQNTDKQCYICIDGQQRFTTTLLLCSSLRDAILKLGKTKTDDEKEMIKSTLKMLETALFVDRKNILKSSQIVYGEDYSFSRLSPSHSDRSPFYKLITEGNERSPNENSSHASSIQEKAKRIFDREIKVGLTQWTGSPVEFLCQCSYATLYKMSLTLVDIESEVNMPQVFLWLQEKGLFGEGSLLYNPTPGINFATSDLVRNLLMAIVAGDNLENQERIYNKLWLDPIESKTKDPDDLGKKIELFQQDYSKTRPIRYVSELEKESKKMSKNMSKDKSENIIVYSEFYSMYEERILRKMMLAPNEIGKAKIGEADQTAIKLASEDILKDLAEWLIKNEPTLDTA